MGRGGTALDSHLPARGTARCLEARTRRGFHRASTRSLRCLSLRRPLGCSLRPSSRRRGAPPLFLGGGPACRSPCALQGARRRRRRPTRSWRGPGRRTPCCARCAPATTPLASFGRLRPLRVVAQLRTPRPHPHPHPHPLATLAPRRRCRRRRGLSYAADRARSWPPPPSPLQRARLLLGRHRPRRRSWRMESFRSDVGGAEARWCVTE
mmetsp:Transcript_13213/g.41888  ORF Transcript_13213/g.41888 Transcript_13213/m.41888 type:complete len:209 (-) Transcript_13213:146-772(-)